MINLDNAQISVRTLLMLVPAFITAMGALWGGGVVFGEWQAAKKELVELRAELTDVKCAVGLETSARVCLNMLTFNAMALAGTPNLSAPGMFDDVVEVDDVFALDPLTVPVAEDTD